MRAAVLMWGCLRLVEIRVHLLIEWEGAAATPPEGNTTVGPSFTTLLRSLSPQPLSLGRPICVCMQCVGTSLSNEIGCSDSKSAPWGQASGPLSHNPFPCLSLPGLVWECVPLQAMRGHLSVCDEGGSARGRDST